MNADEPAVPHHGSYGRHLERGEKLERSGYTIWNWLGHGVAGISELAFVCIRHETFVIWAAATATQAAAAEKPPERLLLFWTLADRPRSPSTGLDSPAWMPLPPSLPKFQETFPPKVAHDSTWNRDTYFCHVTWNMIFGWLCPLPVMIGMSFHESLEFTFSSKSSPIWPWFAFEVIFKTVVWSVVIATSFSKNQWGLMNKLPWRDLVFGCLFCLRKSTRTLSPRYRYWRQRCGPTHIVAIRTSQERHGVCYMGVTYLAESRKHKTGSRILKYG